MPRRRAIVPAAACLAAVAALGASVVASSPARAQAAGPCDAVPATWGEARADLAGEVLDRLDRLRAEHGLAPLGHSGALTRAAEWKAGHMAAGGYLDHRDPDTGRGPGDRARDCGDTSSSVGENIAEGHADADAVMAAWAASPGHRENMLQPGYSAVGVGAVRGADGRMRWVQLFGGDAPVALRATAPPDDQPVVVGARPADPRRPAGGVVLGDATVGALERAGNVAPVTVGRTVRARRGRAAVPLRRLAADADGDRVRVRITGRPPARAATAVVRRGRMIVRLAAGRRAAVVVRFSATDPSGASARGWLRVAPGR